MLTHLRSQLNDIVLASLDACGTFSPVPLINIDAPANKEHGDLACNAALQLSKVLKRNPMEIAEKLADRIRLGIAASLIKDKVKSVEILRPGFINFRLAPGAYHEVLAGVLGRKEDYGRTDLGKGKKVLVEFVSANPTGPLTVAHARQAAVGDILVNILNFTGHHAEREFYVNDGGNQIRTLGLSVQLRCKELFGGKIEYPEDCYQGGYIQDMAKIFSDRRKFKGLADVEACPFEDICSFAKDHLMDVIREDLRLFRVKFDNWSFESEISTPARIAQTLEDLRKKGFIYEKDGALWFKSTQFGDDKDRVVKKSDGFYTYLAPDIVYHKNKYDRGFDLLVDILGPDHHGYIPRIKAAAQALGKDVNALEVLIIQLASIFRDGKQLRMSTRAGEFIPLREVVEEVGTDAGRYFMLMRQVSQQLEFDIDLAKKQASENPVYYIQYGHARCHSVMNKARSEASLVPSSGVFDRLTDEAEIDLIKKMAQFSECLDFCSSELDPYALARYMLEFALVYHKFYDRCKIMDPQDAVLSAQRLALVDAARVIFANGLRLLGISAPEKM
jgi:arginyl-tRNA synthetase